jgi:alkanesulfonate monooxygenase SsuD/methylene tetrahydromethanopterin reductase-like flavin-dependent oxidoreductase (luciferase family)
VLKLDFFLKLDNRFGDGKWVEKVVVEADKLGFDGFLMSDHYMWQTREPVDVTTLETWITLTYLAAKTNHIHLGTQFSPIPFRPPGVFAKMLSTLDILSNGRIILGVGAGWSEAEFKGYSHWGSSKERVDRTLESLDLMLKLWKEPEVTFKGKYYTAERAVLEPKPVQKPYPTLFVSGRAQSYRMLGLAGRLGDIFNVNPRTARGEVASQSEVLEGKDYVYDVAKKAGRPIKPAYTIDVRSNQYNSTEYMKKVESVIALGAKYVVTYFPRDKKYVDYLREFSREVIPSFT